MKPFLTTLLATALLLASAAFAASEPRTFFVSPDGSDSADGLSAATAFATPQHAHDRTEPGDTVIFLPGEWTVTGGQALLDISRSGTREAPITYRAEEGAHVHFRNHGAWAGIRTHGASHIIIDGFHISGLGESIPIEEARREMNNLNNPRTSGSGINIVSNLEKNLPSAHVWVKNNTIHDLGGGGIALVQSSFTRITDNIVYRNSFFAPYANSGISVYQPVSDGSEPDEDGYTIRIERNVVFANYNRIPFVFSNQENPEERTFTDGNGIILDDFNHNQTFFSAFPSHPPYGGRT
ncbi:MAG: right-handed parallel beta-helix repeat-containing protein, partial [Puniceicoccaceae bacterium]